MATHNFQIFDESLTNIDTDIEYTGEAQRLNGVTPGIAAPKMHNKLYRQCSVMAYAIAQVIVARGYNANDNDPAALASAIQRTFAFNVNGNAPNQNGAVTTKAIDAWPVGSIFFTMSNQNPSTLLGGGTWAKIEGEYILASSSTYTAGNEYGAMTKTITTSNLPSHTHTFTANSNGAHTHSLSGTAASNGSHSHTRGTMNITGKFGLDDRGTWVGVDGAFSVGNAADCGAEGSDYGYVINFDASKSWSGATSVTGAHTHTLSGSANNAGAHTHTGTTNSTGGGTAFNVMPKSIAVNVWRRTA